MKDPRKKHHRLALILIPLVCLLSCCFYLNSGKTEPSYTETEITAEQTETSYEQYSEAVLTARKDFDELTDELFLNEAQSSLLTLHYTLADPASYGITDYDNTLGTVSLEDNQETTKEIKSLLSQLDTIDSSLLTEDQRLTYTILSSYLNTASAGEGMELYDQPLSSSLGIQAQLPILLSEYVFYSRQDIEDYLSLLSSIDTYYDSIIAFEKEKTEAGLGLCDTAIDRITASCTAYLLDADHSFMAETFSQRLDQVEGLTEEEKNAYIEENRKAIDEHFVPAYQALIDGLAPLKGKESNSRGLAYLPKGQEYYQYLVNLYTGTSYEDISQLKKAMSDQMLADLLAMNTLLSNHSALGDEMYSYAFSLTEPNEILEDLKQQCEEKFPSIDGYVCNIKNVPQALEGILSPAFYLTVPIDRPQDNSIYINNGSTSSEKNLYSTLAHEGYPGHMYQTLYFNKVNDCNLRKLLSFNSYSEGWATYVEYESYCFDNGLDPDLRELLRHNSAFTLALYAILDINIHYEGWDMDQVKDYLNQYFRINDSSVITDIYYDIAENPANYLEYYVGYLEIINMKQEAKRTLGDAYSDLDFHRFLLDIGPAPFRVIRPYFNEWLTDHSSTDSSS